MHLFLAGLALMTALAPDFASQESGPPGRVSGRVTQEGTNTPVAGARVFLVLEVPPLMPFSPPAGTMTDQDGRYVLDAVPPGRYRISAQKASFAPPMDPAGMRPVELAAGQALDGVDISMQRGGVIAGHVFDAAGEPMIEARVTVMLKRLATGDRSAPPLAGAAPVFVPFGASQTNDLGEFRIYGLPAGEYLVAADPKPEMGEPIGSAPTSVLGHTFFGGVADAASARPVTVRAGDTLADVDIRLIAVPAFRVSGVVVDETGAPVAGAMVRLMGDPRRGIEAVSMMLGSRGMDVNLSDADGRFAIEGVVSGSYVLTAASGADGGFSGAMGAVSETFAIGPDGVPRAGGQAQPAPRSAPGSVSVIVENANVSEIRLVVRAPR